MDCAEYKRWLSSYLDGVLDQAQRTELEAHLKGCQGCASQLGSLKKLQVLLRGLGEVEAPKDLLAGVHAKLSREPRWKRLVAWWPLAFPRHGVALAMTALLVIFVVAIPFYLKPAIRSQKRLATNSVSVDRELKDAAEVAAPHGPEELAVQEGIAASNFAATASLGSSQLADAIGRRDETEELRQGIFWDARTPAGETSSLSRIVVTQGDALAGSESAQTSGAPQGASPPVALQPQGPALEREPAFVSQASPESKQALIQLRWAVADRMDATVQLTAWLRQIQGATLAASGDRLVVQLPISQYAALLGELVRYGSPSSPGAVGAKETDQLNEQAGTGGTFALSAKTPAAERPANEPLVTVELTLVVPSE